MSQPRALVASVGCKLSQAEADLWKVHLAGEGYDIVNGAEEVDLCLVTTCTVTGQADRSSVALIRRLHRRYPQAEIKVTGCGTEAIADRLAVLEGVGEIVRFHDKEGIIADLGMSKKNRTSAIARSRAFLRVGDGCDRRCTYCIVSRIRGSPRSKSAKTVITELKALADAGYGEVVLVALNLGLWGREHGDDLANLLERIDECGIRTRIRLTSLEPDTITPELIDVIASSEKICPHLHVPLQSGDDGVLKRMERPYNTAGFAELIDSIQRRIPDVCIGSDIITATPGEDEASFAKTLEFVRELPVAYLHAFTYSPRPGTPMARAKRTVKNPRERTAVMRSLGNEKSLDYRNRFIGEVREGVVLSPTRVLTDNYTDVTVSHTTARQRSLVKVRITGTTPEETFGEVPDSKGCENEA
ncbi:MiaB/RimO family radical SAM methylthiotransferase [candidate division WOR-3 bacterium]|uniref:MiaB/RimO family radical SAM methylthiotransferase n=1 Tax=candidate division WOR-3 bacterium TaxID=2052148 RepID=A0A9D5KB44_UNCW3|nr:MiaB/RimO family radical SAM methylthiotransferase [candidate division WOR-3 bacterium]MBD3365465.1 MiaB/RimO family radical SAM methylthiotransferase [candidate division WOR-3 bacterium]